ncbi:NAD-dependent epimerase/dehydratase family protein, partial [Chloroflexota bacterium]
MLALVTGSTGFIGSHLCRALTAAGHEVRAFHRPNSSLLLLGNLDVEHCIGDVTQPDSLADSLKDVEVVFHTAAKLGIPRDPDLMYAVTVGGTRNVLNAAKTSGVRRVIHTSTVAALGVPEKPHIIHITPPAMDENHTWNFPPKWWPYGHSKYLAEMEVQNAVANGLDAVIVNPALVIGAGDINRVGGNVIIKAAQGILIAAPPGGLNVVHIDDVVRGHLAAHESGRVGERYILGGQNLGHMKFLQIVADVVGVQGPRAAVPEWLIRGLARPVEITAKI